MMEVIVQRPSSVPAAAAAAAAAAVAGRSRSTHTQDQEAAAGSRRSVEQGTEAGVQQADGRPRFGWRVPFGRIGAV